MEDKNPKSVNTGDGSRVPDSSTAQAGEPSSGTAAYKGNSQKSMLEHWFLFVEDEEGEKEKNRITLKPKENENS